MPKRVVYEDADVKFCILVDRYTGVTDSTPHDHVHSWTIYGHADGAP